ncbi:Smc5-Smc6 complex subunit NSE5 NDAI_0C00890 [Naumovozyma dairenensis CBS 421]|uniref:Uncharacterized protein n=1 Tax=Naumovozyma dairenensis (strain ATCC 10597 / BCRC 20456 / CBS 421 / NBRC 0211 / NRRL Y-12639) TaxID=1071378 RepID=G0W7I9_NAUDC|nr:hypothetical protein NDAI_0C00890 [Naumovozyma dairenensis CBS 421]CCD23750.1 hypothetical protein NDAI_0C00890 [Naumovozyma dairenensis CBS 421]
MRPSCSRSVDYVIGNKSNERRLPHYFVELTERHLGVFEVLNSMCLLDNYDHILFFLECQMVNTKTLPIPPYDICLVLLTLATTSNYYKADILQASDAYNFTRQSLDQRALKILRFYIRILLEFDTSKYEQYDLEFLRCQFFLVIDTLSPKRAYRNIDRFKRRKVENSKLIYGESISINEDELKDLQNPYRSYLSSLERKKSVLGNTLINWKLTQPGEFINMILWTLSNSLQDDPALYLSSHDVWMPILDIILELFNLRQKYFLKNEIGKGISADLCVQRLSESPLSRFFQSVDSIHFTSRFCDYMFINCDYSLKGSDNSSTSIHPVYHGENQLSKLYVPRTKYTKVYKARKSFQLRRKIIGSCFKLLIHVPDKHKLISPRGMSSNDIVDGISRTLATFQNIEQFRSFFLSDSLSQEVFFIPLLAEGTLAEIIENHRQHQEEGPKTSIKVVKYLGDTEQFLLEFISLFEKGFMVPYCDKKITEKVILEIKKGDICVLVLFRYLLHLIPSKKLKCVKSFNHFIEVLKWNDSKRLDVANTQDSPLDIPTLYLTISKMLEI